MGVQRLRLDTTRLVSSSLLDKSSGLFLLRSHQLILAALRPGAPSPAVKPSRYRSQRARKPPDFAENIWEPFKCQTHVININNGDIIRRASGSNSNTFQIPMKKLVLIIVFACVRACACAHKRRRPGEELLAVVPTGRRPHIYNPPLPPSLLSINLHVAAL